MLVCEEKDGEDERIESEILSNVGEYSYYIENRIKIRCTENRNWKNENPCKISFILPFVHIFP